ncbi:MAG: hypothetical protein R3185_04585 [Candidatus Thermoplasmatota archaeon]|nr:hypothetical protein [Candidatus Thermoplasmatota archaeon]
MVQQAEGSQPSPKNLALLIEALRGEVRAEYKALHTAWERVVRMERTVKLLSACAGMDTTPFEQTIEGQLPAGLKAIDPATLREAEPGPTQHGRWSNRDE